MKKVKYTFLELDSRLRSLFWGFCTAGPIPENRPDLGNCWNWTRGLYRRGYGEFRVPGVGKVVAHRIAWFILRGRIPEGLEPDHLCRNRACVRPGHIELVPEWKNILRGSGVAAINAKKTHCDKGHPLSGDNLFVRKSGHRLCRQCHRDSLRRRRAPTLKGKPRGPYGRRVQHDC